MIVRMVSAILVTIMVQYHDNNGPSWKATRISAWMVITKSRQQVVDLTDRRGHHSGHTSDSEVRHKFCALFSTGVSSNKTISDSSAT